MASHPVNASWNVKSKFTTPTTGRDKNIKFPCSSWVLLLPMHIANCQQQLHCNNQKGIKLWTPTNLTSYYWIRWEQIKTTTSFFLKTLITSWRLAETVEGLCCHLSAMVLLKWPQNISPVKILWLESISHYKDQYKAWTIYRMQLYHFGWLNRNDVHSLCSLAFGSNKHPIGWSYDEDWIFPWK